jgi:hypothetical protein
VNRSYNNTSYEENVNICVPIFNEQLGLKSSLSTATQIFRQFNINIYNFKNDCLFKSFLNTLDFTVIELLQEI